ncbi:MAG: hypothetical protein JST82_13065 [Bacteroidetes bacterium]|nr:hypothetical protein [Bacteroidota bacterium]
MRRFRWLLNWSIEEITTRHGDIISVMVSGRNVGTCLISIEGNNIVGEFNLNEDLNNEHYLLYVISSPDAAGQRWLTGIMILPPDGHLQNRARTVNEMNEERTA